MLELTYQLALVSFCDELTSPNARPVAVAAMAVAWSSELRIGAVLGPAHERPLAKDELSNYLLGRLPEVLQGLLLKYATGGSPSGALERVHGALRNSIHVAHVSKTAKFQSADVLQASLNLLELTADYLSQSAEQGTPSKHRKVPPGRFFELLEEEPAVHAS